MPVSESGTQAVAKSGQPGRDRGESAAPAGKQGRVLGEDGREDAGLAGSLGR